MIRCGDPQREQMKEEDQVVFYNIYMVEYFVE